MRCTLKLHPIRCKIRSRFTAGPEEPQENPLIRGYLERPPAPAMPASAAVARNPSCPGSGLSCESGIHHDPATQFLGQPQVTVIQVQSFWRGIVFHGNAQFRRPPQHRANVNGKRLAPQQQPARRMSQDPHVRVFNRASAPAPSSPRVPSPAACAHWQSPHPSAPALRRPYRARRRPGCPPRSP